MKIERVGPYQILEELGQGGMGIVYRARQPSLQRTIALKVLPPELEHDREAVRRFHEEGVTAARLRHENIVAVYDAHVDSPPYYIAMEFLSGQSLADVLSRGGRIDPRSAIGITTQLCQALDHAHSRGIVHRDVKPANIMVDETGKATLTDFGIARMQDRTQVTSAGAVLGSPNYMAPEQAQGKPADQRSDIYGCGAVLYVMLTGTAPFSGDDTLAVMYQIVNEDPPCPRELVPDVPPGLNAVAMKALSRDPDRRYQSASEMLDALRSVAPEVARQLRDSAVDSGRTIVGPAAPPLEATSRGPRRRRAWTLIGGTAVLLLGAAAVILSTAVSRAREGGFTSAAWWPVRSSSVDTSADEPPGSAPDAQSPAPGGMQAGISSHPRGQEAQSQGPDGLDGHTSTNVQVPDLAGNSEHDAEERLTAVGLRYAVGKRLYHSTVPRGHVISQEPEPGDGQDRGSEVSVVLSLGPRPRVRRRSRDRATPANAPTKPTGEAETVPVPLPP